MELPHPRYDGAYLEVDASPDCRPILKHYRRTQWPQKRVEFQRNCQGLHRVENKRRLFWGLTLLLPHGSPVSTPDIEEVGLQGHEYHRLPLEHV